MEISEASSKEQEEEDLRTILNARKAVKNLAEISKTRKNENFKSPEDWPVWGQKPSGNFTQPTRAPGNWPTWKKPNLDYPTEASISSKKRKVNPVPATGMQLTIPNNSGFYTTTPQNSANNNLLFGYYANPEHMLSSIRSLKKHLQDEKNQHRETKKNVKMLDRKATKLQESEIEYRKKLIDEKAKSLSLEEKVKTLEEKLRQTETEKETFRVNFCFYAKHYQESLEKIQNAGSTDLSQIIAAVTTPSVQPQHGLPQPSQGALAQYPGLYNYSPHPVSDLQNLINDGTFPANPHGQ